jgi:hypothetical protein
MTFGINDVLREWGMRVVKVKELIKKLSECDQELEVICYTEDTNLVAKQHQFSIFLIEDVNMSEAEKRRGDDQVPTLKFGRGPYSKKMVFLDVTSEF